MAFRLALNPPELNPRLKVKPSETGQAQRLTAATLWMEIGNGRLRIQDEPTDASVPAGQSQSSNQQKR